MFAAKLSPRSWKVYADCQITSVCKLGLLVYSPAPEYFSPVGCHKMAFCPQIKEQKTLSCLPLASEMYRHSMALNSTCRGRDKISHLKKFKFVFLRASQWSLVKWPLSGRPTADKELVDSWLDSRSQVLYFGLVPSPSHFGNY